MILLFIPYCMSYLSALLVYDQQMAAFSGTAVSVILILWLLRQNYPILNVFDSSKQKVLYVVFFFTWGI